MKLSIILNTSIYVIYTLCQNVYFVFRAFSPLIIWMMLFILLGIQYNIGIGMIMIIAAIGAIVSQFDIISYYQRIK